MQGKILIILLFALIVAIFSIQNASPVLIRVFTWQYQVSLVYIILGAVALGVIIMGVFSSLRQLRLKRKLRSLQTENEKLEEINRVMEERINNLTAADRDEPPGELKSRQGISRPGRAQGETGEPLKGSGTEETAEGRERAGD